jgi:hypothetical protein
MAVKTDRAILLCEQRSAFWRTHKLLSAALEYQKAMTFCDADACRSCPLAKGEPECLRRKANFCLWLALTFPKSGMRTVLEKLGRDLIKDSEALEQERVVLSRRDAAS